MIENDRERGLMEGKRAVSLEQHSVEDPMLAGLELATAHLLAYARLESESVAEGEGLREGEWGYAKLEGGQRYRLGFWLFDRMGTYLRERLEKARRPVVRVTVARWRRWPLKGHGSPAFGTSTWA